MSTTVPHAPVAEQTDAGEVNREVNDDVCCDGCSLPVREVGDLVPCAVTYQNGTTGTANYCADCVSMGEEFPGWLAQVTEIAKIERLPVCDGCHRPVHEVGAFTQHTVAGFPIQYCTPCREAHERVQHAIQVVEFAVQHTFGRVHDTRASSGAR